MRILSVAAAAAALLLPACSTGESAPAAPSEDPRVNAGACRTFDDAMKLVHQTVQRTPRAPDFVAQAAAEARPQVDSAALLAHGAARQEMERVSAALQLLGAKQDEFLRPGYDDSAQVTALRNTAAAVAVHCTRAGVTILVP